MKTDSISYSKLIFSITFILFLVKLFTISIWGHINLFEVHDIAVNMIQKGEMSYFLNGQNNYNCQFPLYPMILYLAYSVTGVNPVAGIIMNLIFQGLTIILSYPVFCWLLSKSELGIPVKQLSLVALISSITIAIHPLINYYTLKNIHPFSLDLLLVFTTLFFMLKYFERKSYFYFIVFGVSLAFAILSRTTNLVIIAPFLIFELRNSHFLVLAKRIIYLMAICVLISSPWMARNYFIYDRLSMNSSLGISLWLGVQEKTGGSVCLPDGKSYYELLPKEEWKQISNLNPLEQSDYFMDKYLKTCSVNYPVVLKMYFIKLKNFWFFRNGIGTGYSEKVKKWIPVYKFSYCVILIFSLFFIFMKREKSILFISFPVFLSLFHSIFYVETRHRVIIEPFLICMAITAVLLFVNKNFIPMHRDSKTGVKQTR